MEFLKKLLTEEEGQGLVEYALIVGLVVFGIWLAISQTGIGDAVTNIFTNVVSSLDDPAP